MCGIILQSKELLGLRQSDSLQLLSERYFNLVFLARTQSGRKIIKVEKNRERKYEQVGQNAFIKEAQILAVLRRHGLPVPKVFQTGEIYGRSYIVMEHLSGVPLDTVFWTLSEREQLMLLSQLHDLLKCIYAIQLPYAGYISDNLFEERPFQPWRTHLIQKLENYLVQQPHTKHRKRISVLLDQIEKVFPDNYIAHSLIHNDLGVRANNILVSRTDSKWYITGIIDWERARSGDPLEELCRLDFELTKGWLLHTIQNEDSRLNTGILNHSFVGSLDNAQIQWYKEYVRVLPTKWYLAI